MIRDRFIWDLWPHIKSPQLNTHIYLWADNILPYPIIHTKNLWPHVKSCHLMARFYVRSKVLVKGCGKKINRFSGKTVSKLRSGERLFFFLLVGNSYKTTNANTLNVNVRSWNPRVDSYWIVNWLAISASKNIKVTVANRYTVVTVKLSVLRPHTKWNNAIKKLSSCFF